jgi:hypothetical protein
MPKYTVTLTETVVTTYDEVEIEADDKETAIQQARELAEEGNLTIDDQDTNYTGEATLIV